MLQIVDKVTGAFMSCLRKHLLFIRQLISEHRPLDLQTGQAPVHMHDLKHTFHFLDDHKSDT